MPVGGHSGRGVENETERFAAKGVAEVVGDLLQRWRLPPDAAEFWPNEAPKEWVDLAGEAAAVSAACEMAGLGGQALWVQLGGRMHQARAQALKAKRCIVDDGDGAKKLSQAID